MEVKIRRVSESAVIPTIAREGDAGYDLVATDVVYDIASDTWIYSTGLSFAIPVGFYGDVRPRSSNCNTEFYLPNSCGVIDSGYRGEVTFRYKCRTSTRVAGIINDIYGVVAQVAGRFGFKVRPELISIDPPFAVGDRIGQIIITPCPKIEFKEVKELDSTERGEGSYGHTGK